MFKWFSMEINSIQELKKVYRALVMANHPDHGGSEESMREINSEYERIFDYVKNYSKVKSDKYAKVNDGFREVVAKLVKLHNIKVEICGSWIWVGGNTIAVKDTLKKYGLKYAAKKHLWFWKPASYVKRSKRTFSIDEIRDRFGSTVLENETETVNAIS